jgi:hypothetical protein
MKNIFSFLSFTLLLLASCTEVSEDKEIITDINFIEGQGQLDYSPLMELTEVIQQSDEEFLDLAKIQETLDNIQQVEINETQVSIYLVELNLSFNKKNLNQFKQILDKEYGNSLNDNKLSSWYIRTSSGKELEISIIEEQENQASLRYLIRSYL